MHAGQSNLIYSEVENSSVLAPAYFKEVIRKKIFLEDYIFFFGDFRGLGKLNEVIGFERSDALMRQDIEAIVKVLPEETLSFRIGGDEYGFIVDQKDLLNDPDFYLDKIHATLATIVDDGVNLKMDIVYAKGRAGTFLDDCYKEVEEKNRLLKLQLKNTNSDNNFIDQLQAKFSEAVDTLFTIFRVNSIEREQVYTDTVGALSWVVVQQLLNKKDCTVLARDKRNVLPYRFIIEGKQYEKFHQAFLGKKVVFTVTEQQEFLNLQDRLQRSSHSNYYNQLYFEREFIPQHQKDPFYVAYLECMGLKVLNAYYGHERTDLILGRIFELVNDALKLEKGDYAFEVRGAKCILLSKNIDKLLNPKVSATIQQINNTLLINSKMHVAYHVAPQMTSNYLEIASVLAVDCNEERDANRKATILSPIGQRLVKSVLQEPLQQGLRCEQPSIVYQLLLDTFVSKTMARLELKTNKEQNDPTFSNTSK